MTTAMCLATAFGASPELLTWMAVLAVGWFVLTLLVFLAGLIWMHRRPRQSLGTNIEPLSRGLRAQDLRADPRYEPKQFRGKR